MKICKMALKTFMLIINYLGLGREKNACFFPYCFLYASMSFVNKA